MPELVFCGAIFRDLSTYVDGFPQRGETKFGAKYQTGFGGKTSNAAVMAAKLQDKNATGCGVAMIGRVGDDENGRAYLENYKNFNVDISNVTLDKERPSGVACIWVDTSCGENEIVIVAGANESLASSHVEAATNVISGARALGVSLEANREGVLTAMRIAKSKGVKVVLNAAPAAPLDSIRDLLASTDVLIVNETEAEIITGLRMTSNTDEAAIENMILELTKVVPEVIMTLGDKGATFACSSDKKVMHCPVPKAATDKVKVVDTTGAGDAFVGAFMYFRFTMNFSIQTSIQRACQIATISVQAEGTQSSYLTRDQLPKDMFNTN